MEVRVNQIEKRSWVEVDLSQIRTNCLLYKKALKRDACIMAVIKADAYGHGDVQVARTLSDIGVNLFAVSNIDEAVGLREAGIRGEILILGYSSPFYAKTLFDLDLTQAIVSEEYAKLLADTGLRIKCQFAIDTGMNRIGIDGDNTKNCEKIIRSYINQLNINGLFTHLCVADSGEKNDEDFTYSQLNKFHTIVDSVSDLELPYIHCCNSAAGLQYLDNYPFFDRIGDIVRLGIVLYGLKPSDNVPVPDGIKPALSWKSVLSMVKNVHEGETIGYGRTFHANKEMIVATVATGYADGLSRALSNKGFVLINGQKAPIIGNICMDQTMVDVSHISNVKVGTHATIIGSSGMVSYSADEMAEALDTIGYEVLCRVSKRVQRFYVSSLHLL